MHDVLFNTHYVDTEVTSNAVGTKKRSGLRRGVTGRVRGRGRGRGTRGRGSAVIGNDLSGLH